MRKGKMGYKTSKRAGSLCELKPTSATRTFQSDCGPTGVNVVSVGYVVPMEYEYEHTVCMKPIGGPHWHRQDVTLLGLVLLASLLASPAKVIPVVPLAYSTWRHELGAARGWCSVTSSSPSSSELVHE